MNTKNTKTHTHTFRPNNQQGFSLIELLIVVAVIAIIAAIAIPYLLHARQAANSASAISSLRIIHSTQVTFRNANGNYGDLTAIANHIPDPRLRQGRKAQYVFTITPDAARPNENYAALATPVDPSAVVGWRHFFVDASGVLRWEAGAPADVNSSPLSN